MTGDGTPGRFDAADFERAERNTPPLAGRLAERQAAEIERFELAVEREIVEASKRGLTAFDLAMILADYASDLEHMDRVPPAWEGEDR